MPPRTIAIGDMHGCSAALDALLAAIALSPEDTLITLGDYIDRGPDSRGVIERLIDLRSRVQLIPLFGNHEIMLQNASHSSQHRASWLMYGGREALMSYGGLDLRLIPATHWAFLEQCRAYHETENHFFIHANYDADLPLAEQPEHIAMWEHLTLMNSRPHRSGKTAIVGHTPQISGEVLNLGHLICIDTHCCGKGYLTALEVNTGQVWQADILGRLRQSASPPAP